ncbi:MAG: hypothetical protein R3D84_10870 [Paracoccaceae bacterium]
MTEHRDDQPIDLGVYNRPGEGGRISAAEVIATLLSLIWLAAVAAFFLFIDRGENADASIGAILVTLLAVFMPLALIWLAATTARTVRGLREESARLRATVDTMRQNYVQQQQTAANAPKSTVEKKLEELAAAQRQTEQAIALFASRRDGNLAVPSADRKSVLALTPASPAEEQPALALGTPVDALNKPALSLADFIRALNFPDSADDREGFRALRLALEDHSLSKLIRAAQDVLTLLSQDGIYMDDLKPDRARPDLWRRFAQGERGRTIAGLGGVRDRSSLALTAGRMRKDPVFRDAAHHFLRQFDRSFVTFEKTASDQDISALAETRTARAFMLFGRVTGTFD